MRAGDSRKQSLRHRPRRRRLSWVSRVALASLVTLGFAACSKDGGPLNKPRTPAAVDGVLNPNTGATGQGTALPKYDPAAARVSFADPNTGTLLAIGEPFLAPPSEGSTVKVPYISVRLQGATYFELMRCDYRYVLQIPTGEALRTLDPNTPDYANKAKWAWQEALGDNRDCHIVGAAIARELVPDMAAPTGGFYYVLNPCVQQELSTTGFGGCSYALVTSNAINFKNEINAKFLELAQALATLESKVTQVLFRLKGLAINLYHQRQSCELIHADQQAHKGFFAAIIQLIVFVVAYAVGTYFGGPAVGAMVANTALSITAMFLGHYGKGELKCPQAEKELATMEHTAKEFQATVLQVYAARKQMSDADARYKEVNDKIVADYINSVQANPHVVTSQFANNPALPQTLEGALAQPQPQPAGATGGILSGASPATAAPATAAPGILPAAGTPSPR